MVTTPASGPSSSTNLAKSCARSWSDSGTRSQRTERRSTTQPKSGGGAAHVDLTTGPTSPGVENFGVAP